MHDLVDAGIGLARRTSLAIAVTAAMAAAGLASAADSAATEVAELPPDLAKAVSDYDQATLHNDVATLAKLIAEDYVLVNSDSTLQDKQQYLADFKVPGFKLDPYVMEQPMQKVLGNTAVTGGLLHLSWTLDGRRERRELRIAHVWVRDSGRWQITYTQLTRVPQ